MKLTKNDIGKEFILQEWCRGVNGIKNSTGIITKVGRVNIEINGRTLKIFTTSEFSIKTSARHDSDHWIKIYRSNEDVEKEVVFLSLLDWFSNYSRDFCSKKLSMKQLQAIKSIVEGRE